MRAAAAFLLFTGLSMAQGFLPAGNLPVQDLPYANLAADFNGDGLDDLATAIYHEGLIAIRIQQASGGFAPPVMVAVNTEAKPYDLAAGDLDGDGDLDLVSANNYSNFLVWYSLTLFENDGGGNFTERQIIEEDGVGGNSVALADLDDDGLMEIAVEKNFGGGGRVRIYREVGGSYVSHQDLAGTIGAYDMQFGDLNGDTHEDLVVVDYVAATHQASVFLNDGSGNLGARTSYVVSANPEGLALADLDGDGTLDIVTANSQRYDSDGNGNLNVLFNSGDGSFVSGPVLLAGNQPYGVVAEDFDGDGDQDLAVNNYVGHSVSYLENLGSSFASAETYSIGGGAYRITAGRLDADHDIDLAISNIDQQAVTLMDNRQALLTQTPLVRGEFAEFRVSNANPQDQVFFLLSLEGTGSGPCFFQGTLCLDLLSPFLILGSRQAGNDGTASLGFSIPAGAPLIELHTQGVILGGSGAEATNPVSASIQP